MKAIWLGGLGGALILFLIGLSIYLVKQNTASVASDFPEGEIIRTETPMAEGKVYVAVENEGVIVVLSEKENKVLARIPLEKKDGLKFLQYTAHNVQVSPDGRSVWVTANASEGSAGHRKSVANVGDEVIVIDPSTDAIVRRIDMGTDNHLSHIVLSPDGKFAYAASQEKSMVTEIDTQTYATTRTFSLRAQSGPHGMRLSPDGMLAILALLEGEELGILDLRSGMTEYIPLPGAAVQTAATPDGKYALSSIYDPASLAVYDLATKELRVVPMPSEAKGPVQIYPSEDSRNIYIADHGVYFNQEAGSTIYEFSLQEMKVTRSMQAGRAPHGLTVSADNSRLYVTNLETDDVSVINIQDGAEIARIPVGDAPNGISVWTGSSLKNP